MPGDIAPSHDLSPWVRAVAAYGVAGGSVLPMPDRPLDDATWAQLLADASSERVLGLMSAAATAGTLPATVRQTSEIRALALDAVRLCLALEGELLHAGALLAGAEIPVRVLKGPAAASLDYPDPTWRSFVDIDILVHSADLDRAVETLLHTGHTREHPQRRSGFDKHFGKGTTLISPHGLFLDIHRTLAMGPFGVTLIPNDLWERSDSFVVGSASLEALPVEERLLHSCYHAALGDWPPRLVPHRDIAQIAMSGRADLARVHELAQRWKGEAVLAAGVTAAWSLLGLVERTRLSEWATDFVPDGRDRRTLRRYATPGARYASLSLAAVRAQPGLRAKAAMLSALAVPDWSFVTRAHQSRGRRIYTSAKRALPAHRIRP